MNAVIEGFNTALLHKYATFSGRASRTEFWSFLILSSICSAVLNIFLMIMIITVCAFLDCKPSLNNAFLQNIGSAPFLIPFLAVSVRRLHDIGLSGWWLLAGVLPCAGNIILLIFFLLPSAGYITAYDDLFGGN